MNTRLADLVPARPSRWAQPHSEQHDSTLCRLALLFTVTAVLAATTQPAAAELKPSSRFDGAIAKFVASDKKSPPAKGQVLFIGSSSIRMWKLKETFPKLDAINRGFGGSYIRDSIHFADKIIFPYEPRTIVLYAGDNDVAGGLSPQGVLADYKKFVALVRTKLPKTNIAFLAIKPSISRWKLVGKMREANRLVREHTEKNPLQSFIDIDTPMTNEDGKPAIDSPPAKKWFIKDGLHLSKEGYKLWAAEVNKHVEHVQNVGSKRMHLASDALTSRAENLKAVKLGAGAKGFAAGQKPGTWTSKPLRFEGELLVIGFAPIDALGKGESATTTLRVALLDAAGQPIEGYSLKDCKPITNAGNHVVQWQAHDGVKAYAGEKLRVQLKYTSGAATVIHFTPALP